MDSAAFTRKIGILTFHRSINYGSYWQARCLVDWLRDRGHNAVIIDHSSRRTLAAELRCALRPHLPNPTCTDDLPSYKRKIRSLRDACDRLPISEKFDIEHSE